MHDTAISYGLLGALAIGLLIAAVTDLRRRQIDNWLNVAIAVTAPLFWWASGLSLIDVAWQLGLCAMTFGITALLFALRQMGGGDVKLLSALALWFVPFDFLRMFIVMALIGGAMSVGYAVLNLKRSPMDGRAVGLAYLTATVWMLFSAYALYVLSGGAPVQLPQLPASPWLGLSLIAALFIALGLGVRKIVRGQAGKYPVPYGLAISAAGLWLIISNHLHSNPTSIPLG